MFNTENEVIKILQDMINPIHPNATVRVGKSEQKENSIIREVTFFILIPASVDRDLTIKEINKLSIKHDRELYFSGSESGMLHGDMEQDWLFITTQIQGI
ncbi:MAG: hypothetical protein U9N52_04850 [Campylobacterota bacterium]|nr:hypothetical protein [Campylobacterota bacterium]